MTIDSACAGGDVVMNAILASFVLSVAAVGAADEAKKIDDPLPRQEAILKTCVAEFVALRPGEDKYPVDFLMGSEKNAAEQPTRRVRFEAPFAIGRYEV